MHAKMDKKIMKKNIQRLARQKADLPALRTYGVTANGHSSWTGGATSDHPLVLPPTNDDLPRPEGKIPLYSPFARCAYASLLILMHRRGVLFPFFFYYILFLNRGEVLV